MLEEYLTRIDDQLKNVKETESIRQKGRVRQVIGLIIQAEGLSLPVGCLCDIITVYGRRIKAEVVGFRDDCILLMPLGETEGIRRGDVVECIQYQQKIGVSNELLGRVIDSLGNPLDGKPPITFTKFMPLYNQAPPALSRKRIKEPIATGIRSIDALVTCGKGQRMGLFSGSGVGKSILLGMIARNTSADVSVIALVGERGREVKEFIERDLGKEGLERSVVVVETGERPPVLRVKTVFTATAIAEYFREQGKHVMLLMDSITRMAMAQRQIGLSIGEPPATKGYPPSVFALLPAFLERAGIVENGSITGIYTILVEGDDINDPVSDVVRSILDGHVWLSRELATRGHYPAVDPLLSISRLMIEVTDKQHIDAATRIKSAIATYKDAEDMINIGAYVKGSNPRIDKSIELIDQINNFLKQGIFEKSSYEETVSQVKLLGDKFRF
jgi:flagellum-specific ATP synthase